MKKPQPPDDIDAYIARFPDDVQSILRKLRETIRNAAPDAQELISYQMPFDLADRFHLIQTQLL
jgi:uncharacterized protein YdhG (YjbR/CyaY superfamily)